MSEPTPTHATSPLAALRDAIGLCVHCGFCLQACPTYLAAGEENDSPRGRILLMRAMADAELAIDDPVAAAHLDRCLGCRACETACPSGVPYGMLLEGARAAQHAHRPPPRLARWILRAFARPRLLALLLALARAARALGVASLAARLPGRTGFGAAMLAATAVRRSAPEEPARHVGTSSTARTDAHSAAARGRAVILRGCVMRGLYAGTNHATTRVLAANGYALCTAPGQRCCGALHAHAGDMDTARRLARWNIAAFERVGADVIVVNASGCGAAMKEYGHLLRDDPAWSARAAAISARVRDVSEVLAAAGPRPGALPPRVRPLRIAYDAPCHLHHAQRVTGAPLQVLHAIAGAELVPLADADQCCGSAGIYNLVQPALADAVLARKLDAIAAAGADIIVTGNPGCLMQIGAGLLRAGQRTRVMHLVDLLDAAYAGREP